MGELANVAAHGVAIRRGGRDVLTDVELALGPGVYELVGANGSGKSTLLRALAGIGAIHRGRIEIAGFDLERDPVRARGRLGYMPETADLFPTLTPRELLATFAAVRRADDDGTAAFASLTRPGALDLRISTLSAGQRRKLALVAAIQSAPTLWLLDEPTDTLDAAACQFLRAAIAAHRDGDGTVLVATHRPGELGVPVNGVFEAAAGRVTSCA
jgi:ABC-type multidrug transport system ATPase subunit